MKHFEMDGYVCGEIETRTTANGKNVTSFSINSPERYKDSDGNWKSRAQFFKCKYWHKGSNDYRADKIQDKAHLVLIGQPRYEEWETDNGKRSRIIFQADDLFVIESKHQTHSEQEIVNDDASAVYDDDIPFN